MIALTAFERARDGFRRCFREEPRWVVAAPGRVNLIGEHTDYNGGVVLPMAIELRTAIAAGPVERRAATVYSAALDETVVFDLDRPVRPGTPHWSNYLRGVAAGFQRAGHSLPGFEAVIESDLPLGGGLASSAALEVAALCLLEAMVGHRFGPIDAAFVCHRAEREFAGVPCGVMDQVVSLMGMRDHALLIDCRTLRIDEVPMSDPAACVLIIDTHVRHDLADGAYARRRAECEEATRQLGMTALAAAGPSLVARSGRLDPVLQRRARHVISENERTLAAARAIRSGDWPKLGALMYDSHRSLSDDFEVSCRELDIVVDTARFLGEDAGVFGCRMTGGGFGGCAICLVRTDMVGRVRQAIADSYRELTGKAATILSSRPSDGARRINTPQRRPAR